MSDSRAGRPSRRWLIHERLRRSYSGPRRGYHVALVVCSPALSTVCSINETIASNSNVRDVLRDSLNGHIEITAIRLSKSQHC